MSMPGLRAVFFYAFDARCKDFKKYAYQFKVPQLKAESFALGAVNRLCRSRDELLCEAIEMPSDLVRKLARALNL